MSGESKAWELADSEQIERALSSFIDLLHKKAPNSIGDLIHLQVGECDVSSGDYTLYASTEAWMCNPYGTLHGGIISVMVDQAMGTLATCLTEGKAITPTVQLSLTFHHPLVSTQRTRLRLHVDAVTRTMLHLRAEAANEQEPEKLCASATGIFYIKRME